MKKFFVFCLLLPAALTMTAADNEDVVFTDADGNVYEDGTVLVLTDVEENIMGDESSDNTYMINSGLYVTNVSDELRHTTLVYEVSEISRGTHSCCFPSLCITMSTTGTYETDRSSVKAGVSKNMITEWYTAGEGNCTATYTLYNYSYDSTTAEYTLLGVGPTITVQYVWSSESTGISNLVTSDDCVSVEYYDAAGARVSNPSKGMFIKKMLMSDGTTKTQKLVIR